MTTPEHYAGRSSGTGAAIKTTKPLILPAKMVEMLHGERGYTENSKDIAELAISFYQDGKAGEPYQIDPPPPEMFPPHVVEWLGDFLRISWEQGRRDAGEVAS